MDDLRTILDNLEDKRLDYVIARARCHSDIDALRESGIGKSAFYQWPREERDHLNDIAQQVKRETATIALMKLTDAAVRAAEVKIAGLSSHNEHVKQDVATEILDRTIGKPTQKTDVTSNGESITVTLLNTDD